jgi:hypothetical protein
MLAGLPTSGAIMSRRLGRAILLGVFLTTAAAAVKGFADDSNQCTVATKGDSPVAKACAQGGVKAAKAKMKQLVKTARDNGVRFECDYCHKDPDKGFELNSVARDKFKELLAAQTKGAAPKEAR